MKNNRAFTLLELVVATTILTISVFWVYKLISENTKSIENSNYYYNAKLLFPSVNACIDNTKINDTIEINDTVYISFWENLDECIALDSPTTNLIDNIDYGFKATKTDEKEWEIEIFSLYAWTLKSSYIQK